MNGFSERLKKIIKKKGLSQAEAAKLCGIAQQSLNYILNNNLKCSKLAPQIAVALDVDLEWLIYGTGKSSLSKLYDLPILHSAYMLKKYLNRELDLESLGITVIDTFLGDNAFAYLTKPDEMAICGDTSPTPPNTNIKDFLTLSNEGIIIITKEQGKISFPIFEWRKRNEDF